jgi:hypothetical protein
MYIAKERGRGILHVVETEELSARPELEPEARARSPGRTVGHRRSRRRQ